MKSNKDDTVTVRSIQRHEYGGITRQVGDLYECEQRFVVALEAVRAIEIVKEAEQPKRKYHRRDMQAEGTKS